MTEAILIKKYENRRLYDTSRSRYINLDGVAELVRQGEQVQVVEAKSGEDITRQVLTQIIVDDSRAADGGPPLEFLRDLVRSSDHAYQDFLQWYLRGAADVYERLRSVWERSSRERRAPWEEWSRWWDPTAAAKHLAQLWQEQLAGARRRPGSAEDREAGAAEAEERSQRDELAELRQRLEELESRLSE